MNRFSTTLLFALIILCSLKISAQNLPESMYLSTDGRRLTTGNKPSEKIYDESIVHRIDLQFSQADYWL